MLIDVQSVLHPRRVGLVFPLCELFHGPTFSVHAPVYYFTDMSNLPPPPAAPGAAAGHPNNHQTPATAAAAAGFPGARLVVFRGTTAWLLPASAASAELVRKGHGYLVLPAKGAEALLPAPMIAAAAAAKAVTAKAAAAKAAHAVTPAYKQTQLPMLRTWSQPVLQAALKHTKHGPHKFQGGWGKARVLDAILALSASDWKLAMTFLRQRGRQMHRALWEQERRAQWQLKAQHARSKAESEARAAKAMAEAQKRKHPWMQEGGAAAPKKAKVSAAAPPTDDDGEDDDDAVVCTGHKTLSERLKQEAKSAHVVDDDDDEDENEA